MTTSDAHPVYQELGVRRVINAQGNRTLLGGSAIAQEIQNAMGYANEHYVEMKELLQKSGEYVAQMLGVEAAYITSGCAAALTLGTAGFMTGKDLDKMAQLPNTSGMKTDILIQKLQRYSYDRCFTLTGANLIEVGDSAGCSAEQLNSAIGNNTAGVAFLARQDWDDSILPLEEVIRVAHENNVPVIVDAASQIYPLDYFRTLSQQADLVCFGAKYFGAPNSTGIACGKREYVELVAAHGFIGFESLGSRAIGRPMKVDRQEIIGVVAALKAWFTMNHEDRIIGYDDKFSVIKDELESVRGIKVELTQNPTAWPFRLEVTINPQEIAKNADQIRDELDQGNPRIWLGGSDPQTLIINVNELNEGDENIVADRLKKALMS